MQKMDNLGSEVGQKMRSAVKAKLIELGTGGLAGYIDDELPDYVMIMIANKRSKQQMIGDLQLFLGSQTELFVTWLHEVLHKLQEVTLPAAVVHKTKRKSDGGNDISVVGKKEKKEKKKDKEKEKKTKKTSSSSSSLLVPAAAIVTEQISKDSTITEQQSSMPTTTATSSISDVFANHLLQKAKKTMQTESVMTKIKKSESSSTTIASLNTINQRDEFDIPTITEISESETAINESEISSREKDLKELAKLQKKIYQAKAKLKLTEQTNEESDDEDYLNIKAEGEELDDDTAATIEKAENRKNKTRVPIVFESDYSKSNENRSYESINEKSREYERFREFDRHQEFDRSRKRVPITFFKDQKREENQHQNKVIQQQQQQKKKPIHERLGFNITKHTSTNINNTSMTPSYRCLDREPYSVITRAKSLEKSYENLKIEEKNEKPRNKSKERDTEEPITMRRRIGSRVIVAPPKKTSFEDDDDDYNETTDKAVSSMIKIKPRPTISPSKQASKNLLLRAVAEAQKSTAFIQPKKDSLSLRDRSPKRLNNRVQKLHTKLYSSRKRESGSAIKRISKDNIVIEIKSSNKPRSSDRTDIDVDDDKVEDEYVPEPIYDRGDSDNDYVYIPQSINFDAADDTSESYDEERSYSQNKTQFVVTLDDKSRNKYTSHHKMTKHNFDDEHLNGVEKERSKITTTNNNNTKLTPTSTSYDEDSCLSQYEYTSSPKSKLKLKAKSSSSSSLVPYQNEHTHLKKLEQRSKVIKLQNKSQKEIKKIIIRNNDSEDDENVAKNEDKLIEINSNDDDGSLTPPLPTRITTVASVVTTTTKSAAASTTVIKSLPASPKKRKRSPIKFDIKDNKNTSTIKNNEKSKDNSKNSLDSAAGSGTVDENNTHKISIKKIEVIKKYENIPESLSAIAIETSSNKAKSVKERCKYFPSCTKGDSCEYYHPTTPCKAFPNCKFVEKCLYLHPKCKFDLTCNRNNCNFTHSSVPATINVAPPLSSHVVPVQNYKSITASALPAICKYYPNCTNSLCTFYHPKLCRFGKNCMNKIECNFYHYELPIKDKFKWVASLG